MVHTPPALPHIEKPLIFLAGPIQGAADWQADAIKLIEAEAPDLDIASPRRPIKSLADFSEDQYFEQVNWEHEHLTIAAKQGVILFWLCKQDHVVEGRSYAQTTRFELGEAVMQARYGDCRLVVGIEDGFTNQRYIRYTIAKKTPSVPLCATLEDTCRAAIELARKRR